MCFCNYDRIWPLPYEFISTSLKSKPIVQPFIFIILLKSRPLLFVSSPASFFFYLFTLELPSRLQTHFSLSVSSVSSAWRAEPVGHRHDNGVVFKVGHSGFTELAARRFTVGRRHLSSSAADDEALVADKTGPLKLDLRNTRSRLGFCQACFQDGLVGDRNDRFQARANASIADATISCSSLLSSSKSPSPGGN